MCKTNKNKRRVEKRLTEKRKRRILNLTKQYETRK